MCVCVCVSQCVYTVLKVKLRPLENTIHQHCVNVIEHIDKDSKYSRVCCIICVCVSDVCVCKAEIIRLQAM